MFWPSHIDGRWIFTIEDSSHSLTIFLQWTCTVETYESVAGRNEYSTFLFTDNLAGLVLQYGNILLFIPSAICAIVSVQARHLKGEPKQLPLLCYPAAFFQLGCQTSSQTHRCTQVNEFTGSPWKRGAFLKAVMCFLWEQRFLGSWWKALLLLASDLTHASSCGHASKAELFSGLQVHFSSPSERSEVMAAKWVSLWCSFCFSTPFKCGLFPRTTLWFCR